MIERFLAPWLLTGIFTGLVPVDAALYAPGPNDFLAISKLLPISATVSHDFLENQVMPPKKRVLQNYTFEATADSLVMIDVASGRLIYGKNIDDQRPIGSITKLMTALVFLEGQPDLEAAEAILEVDRTYGGRFYLPFSTNLKVADILSAALVGSDNSATTTLVRISGKTEEEFVEAMNERSLALGLTHTSFEDWTGLSPNNQSTARDVARLLGIALEQPEIASRVRLPEVSIAYEGGVVTIPSTNELVGTVVGERGEVVGGKTGYIPEAGYCVTARVMRGEREGVDVVVLSSTSREGRFVDLERAISWAHETFEWPTYE
jgi:D-alanyl-D-alanine endopeptidase (penicillin-binding protein 7)